VLLGGTAATWLGPWLYATHGVKALSWTGMAAAAAAFVLLMTRVDEGA